MVLRQQITFGCQELVFCGLLFLTYVTEGSELFIPSTKNDENRPKMKTVLEINMIKFRRWDYLDFKIPFKFSSLPHKFRGWHENEKYDITNIEQKIFVQLKFASKRTNNLRAGTEWIGSFLLPSVSIHHKNNLIDKEQDSSN